MSSSNHQQHINPLNLKMLRGVLKEVRRGGNEACAGSDSERTMARFLIAEFQKGNNTRERLIASLKQRDKLSENEFQTPEQSPKEAVDRWPNEGEK